MKVRDIKTLIKRGYLTKEEKLALDILIKELKNKWPGTKAKIFGSKVKGTAAEESDLDVLILLPFEISEDIRKQIIHKVFNLNLEYGTNISPLIISEEEWENGLVSLLPIHSFIEEEGIQW